MVVNVPPVGVGVRLPHALFARLDFPVGSHLFWSFMNKGCQMRNVALSLLLLSLIHATTVFAQPAASNDLHQQTAAGQAATPRQAGAPKASLNPEPGGHIGIFPLSIALDNRRVDPSETYIDALGKLGVTYLRPALHWSLFEPQKGVFDWNNSRAKSIDDYIAKGFKIIPVIKCVSPWAVKYNEGMRCASPPKDMRSQPDERYAYSETYYNFIRKLAEHYKGKFEYVSIEIEVHDPHFWHGTMDEYLHLLATARKAFKEVDPNIQITDCGIQGGSLGWFVMQDHMKARRSGEALAYFRKTNPANPNARNLERKMPQIMGDKGSRTPSTCLII